MLQTAVRIRFHLLLLAAVVLAPALLAAVIGVAEVRKGEREAGLRNLRETVRSSSLLVDGQIRQSIGALSALANSPSLQSGDLRRLYEEARAIDRQPDVWTLLLDENGRQLFNTAVPFGTPAPPAAAKDRVARVLATGQPYVSELLVGPATGKLITTLYVPAGTSPHGRWVIAQAFSVEHWKKTALQPQGLDSWVVGVIDSKGRFISRSHRAEERLGMQARPELVAAAAAASAGLIRHATLEGVDSYDAFTHSALTGWTIAIAAPVPTIEASATRAIGWLIAGLGIAVLLAVTSAWLLSGTLVRAIDSASASARALGAGRRPRAEQTSVLEVNALNAALVEAGGVLEGERTARATAERERELLLANERAAREQAERENAAKDQFLALLGHELRNPMAAIGGAAELLARSELAAAGKPGRFVAIVQRQSRHLRRIVDDLLEVSRMLTGKIVLDQRPLDLAACVRSCIESIAMSEAAHEHRLVGHLDEAWIEGDSVRIEQIVSNLVGNALKFSPAGSTIGIGVARAAGEVRLEISDAGAGLEPGLLARVFEPFFQGPPLPGRQAAGLGIGLALTRQLVELHGGRVTASSPGPGQGATFAVTLPAIERPAGIAAAAPAQGEGSGCEVLLVEDNADAREATSALLRELGYRVCEATDGEAALRLAGERQPAVAIMDIGLPGRSGLEVAAIMKGDPALAAIPLIALSGYGQERDKAASRAAGFADHLVKPVMPDALAESIERRVAERSAATRAGPL